mmetsp:Transcript_1990/g.3734  ORF Transcript_1990/g.3734 Transcript_1990/m.3734 type:complete len:238 (-) Transcript_1990:1348-2061(-)
MAAPCSCRAPLMVASSCCSSTSMALCFSMVASASEMGLSVSRLVSYSSAARSLAACVENCILRSACSWACLSCVSSYSRMDDTPTLLEKAAYILSCTSLIFAVSDRMRTSRSCRLVWQMATSGSAFSRDCCRFSRSICSFLSLAWLSLASSSASRIARSRLDAADLACSNSSWRSRADPSSFISSISCCLSARMPSSAWRSKRAALASMDPEVPPVITPPLERRVPSRDTTLCCSRP